MLFVQHFLYTNIDIDGAYPMHRLQLLFHAQIF